MEISEKFTVEDRTETLEDLLERKPSLSDELYDSGVVILPSHNTDNAFYSGTLDILDYLNESSVQSTVFATDEEYKELSLHGADIWLGTFFIKNIVIPIFCSVIASYLYERLNARPGDKVSVKFVVERKNGETVAVEYKGKVDDLDKALNTVKSYSDED
jgi:dsDNA-binding SOS-regulon protein